MAATTPYDDDCRLPNTWTCQTRCWRDFWRNTSRRKKRRLNKWKSSKNEESLVQTANGSFSVGGWKGVSRPWFRLIENAENITRRWKLMRDAWSYFATRFFPLMFSETTCCVWPTLFLILQFPFQISSEEKRNTEADRLVGKEGPKEETMKDLNDFFLLSIANWCTFFGSFAPVAKWGHRKKIIFPKLVAKVSYTFKAETKNKIYIAPSLCQKFTLCEQVFLTWMCTIVQYEQPNVNVKCFPRERNNPDFLSWSPKQSCANHCGQFEQPNVKLAEEVIPQKPSSTVFMSGCCKLSHQICLTHSW